MKLAFDANRARIGRGQFHHIYHSPIAWIMRAEEQFRAAMILLEHSWKARTTLDREYFAQGSHEIEPNSKEDELLKDNRVSVEAGLLASLAMENLLSGLWIAQHYAKRTQAPKELAGHNLVILAEKCNISLDNEKRALLETMSDALRSFGKYPSARNKDANAFIWGRGSSPGYLTEKYPGACDFPDSLNALIDEVSKLLQTFPNNRINGFEAP